MFGITYVIFTFGGLTENAASFSEISSQTSDLENKLMKTSIDVTVSTSTGTTSTFDFEIKNTNSEKLWDFEYFDVIVTYDSGSPATTYTEYLTYDLSCPPVAGQWCINNWDADVIDPGILNDGETITVDAEVNNPLKNNSDLIVVVSTDQGIVDSVTVKAG